MVMKVSLEVKLDSLQAFDEFRKEFRSKVIETGLDKTLQTSVIELKTELKTLINNKSKETQIFDSKADITKENKLGIVPAQIPKSTDELLRYFTGADPKKHMPQANHNTVDGSNMLTVQPSKNTSGPNRVDLRMATDPDESVEDHYARALQVFQNSIFTVPNDKGTMDHFLNTGEELDDVTKIDCSTMTGDGDIEPKKGMSPARRFELDKDTKGYSTWTIKQDFIERMRRGQTRFVNINPVIKSIQDGNPEEAARIVNRLPANDATKSIQEKVANITTGTSLPTTLSGYLRTIGLINNLKIQKIIKPSVVTYRLISTSGSVEESEKKFLDEIKSALTLWAVSSADKWFKDLVIVTERVIKNFSGG